MKAWKPILVSIVALAGHQSAQATTIFADNFDAENGGAGTINYASFAQWDVSNGSVDLIGNGYADFLPGNGLYLDMDGSTLDAGRITTKTTFSFSPGTNYTLSFYLAGNQRNAVSDTVRVIIGGGIFVNTFSLPWNAPFTAYSYGFSVAAVTTGKISFEGLARNSQILGSNEGLLLDNVVLDATSTHVPDAAGTAALLGSTLVGLLAIARRRAA